MSEELTPNLEKSLPKTDPNIDPERVAKRIGQILSTCIAAIEQAKGKKRAYVVMEIAGDRPGGWIEVYPGVKGQAIAFGRRSTKNLAGEVVETRLTKVKVCARSMLRALERDGVIRRTEVHAPPGADVAEKVVLP